MERVKAGWKKPMKSQQKWLITIASVIFGAILFAQGRALAQGTWTIKATIPAPGSVTEGDVGNGKRYTFGDSVGAANVKLAYDPTTDSWSSHTPDPVFRAQAATVFAGGKFYLMGGCVNGDCIAGLTNLNEVYDPLADTWTTLAPMPAPLNGTAHGVISGKIYLAGGMLQFTAGSDPTVHTTQFQVR